MASIKNKTRVFDEIELADIEQQLRDMVVNKKYNTDASYSANLADYPSHLIPFVDKHMNYIVKHSNIDPEHYLANLRLITKIRV